MRNSRYHVNSLTGRMLHATDGHDGRRAAVASYLIQFLLESEPLLANKMKWPEQPNSSRDRSRCLIQPDAPLNTSIAPLSLSLFETHGFVPKLAWHRARLVPRRPHRLLLHPGLETQPRPSALSPRPKGVPHNRQSVRHPKCLHLQALPRNESRFGRVPPSTLPLRDADQPPPADSDIIHLQVFGFHLIVCNSKGVADDLLDKRSSIYSDR